MIYSFNYSKVNRYLSCVGTPKHSATNYLCNPPPPWTRSRTGSSTLTRAASSAVHEGKALNLARLKATLTRTTTPAAAMWSAAPRLFMKNESVERENMTPKSQYKYVISSANFIVNRKAGLYSLRD